MKKILDKIKEAQASHARRKKFEKMREQLDPPPKRRPAAKCAKK
jgi:hypothetical protein